jgi:SAM-dependent methyltransferase
MKVASDELLHPTGKITQASRRAGADSKNCPPGFTESIYSYCILHFGSPMYLKQLVLAGLAAGVLFAQAEHPITGRRIASVMGMGGAEWLERSEREIEELPETALDKIGLKTGMTVADVGAGVGYFTVRLGKRIGSGGKVYAVDVQPEMLAILKDRAAKSKLTNIQPILGSESDPHLPPASCDLILMVDVYHELSQPQKMLQKMKQSLKD